MSNRKIKIRAIDAHKRQRNGALQLWSLHFRTSKGRAIGHSDIRHMPDPLDRMLATARAAITEHRQLGKDGRFLARIEDKDRGRLLPPEHARTRGQWRRLAEIAKARGWRYAARLCDGCADGWRTDCAVFPDLRGLDASPGKSPWNWADDTTWDARTHHRHA